MGLSVFAEPRHVDLNHRADASIRSFLSGRMAIQDPRHPRFRIAHDRAAGMTRYGVAAVIEPRSIASGNQEFGIDAAKPFGISIFDECVSIMVHGKTICDLALSTQPIR